MIEQLPFIPGQVYNRRAEIHAVYGGNWQSGICPSASYPYIFIFSGKSGKQHGYEDGWDNPNVFSYTGEGQKGDMNFTKGNLALRDHLINGKRVFLFESYSKGFVKFKCEVTGFDKLAVLIASHIVPWTDSNDNERLDVNNGLLLSPTYDALFDKHFISFEDSGSIILSDTIELQAFEKIGVIGSEKINNLSEYNLKFLDRHRIRFYESI